jgi:hypothetical protein
MGLLATSQFHFIFPSVEVSQELNFSFNQMREEGRAVTTVDRLLLCWFQWKNWILHRVLCCSFSLWDILDLSDFALSSSSLRIVSHLIF